jgi:uncharacterized membrane protein
MKKTDIAMIVLIASVSVMVAYFVANSLPLFKDAQKPVSVKVADAITSDIDEVDKTVFNKEAINPTVEVIIGGIQPVGSTSTDTAN